MSTATSWLDRAKALVLWLVGLTALSAGVMMGLADKAASSATLLAAGVLLLLLANFEKLEFIKGLGIEAKARQLDVRIGEADKVLANLKEMLRTMAKFTFHVMATEGRFDSGIPRRDALAIARSLEAQLREIGIDRSEIEAAMAPWHNINAVDLIRPSLDKASDWLYAKSHSVQAQVQSLADAGRREDPQFALLVAQFKHLDSLGHRFRQLAALPAIAIAGEIENILQGSDVLTEHEKAQIRAMVDADLRAMQHYVRTKSFLDEQAWIDTDPLSR